MHSLADQDLARGGLGAEPGREVRDAADGRVVGATLEADPAEGGVTLRDSDGEVEVVALATPPLRQLADADPHRDRHPHRAQRRVVAWDRVVEEHHETVAGEALERPLEAVHQIAQRGVVLPSTCHHVLGLDRLRERREAAQVAEHDRDLAPVALQERVVARGDDAARRAAARGSA